MTYGEWAIFVAVAALAAAFAGWWVKYSLRREMTARWEEFEKERQGGEKDLFERLAKERETFETALQKTVTRENSKTVRRIEERFTEIQGGLEEVSQRTAIEKDLMKRFLDGSRNDIKHQWVGARALLEDFDVDNEEAKWERLKALEDAVMQLTLWPSTTPMTIAHRLEKARDKFSRLSAPDGDVKECANEITETFRDIYRMMGLSPVDDALDDVQTNLIIDPNWRERIGVGNQVR